MEYYNIRVYTKKSIHILFSSEIHVRILFLLTVVLNTLEIDVMLYRLSIKFAIKSNVGKCSAVDYFGQAAIM